MNFQNLRQNNTLYVLYKNIPKLEIGKVSTVSPPIPKFTGNFQDMVVDISIKVSDNTLNFQKIPYNTDFADLGNNIIISSDKQKIIDEIQTLKQQSQSIVESVDFHRNNISKCDDFIKELNPEILEKEIRDKETKELKQEISSLKDMVSKLITQIKQ